MSTTDPINDIEDPNSIETAIGDLLQMWKEDAKIDRTDPGTELSKIGSLHSKYLTILSMNRRSLKQLERSMKKLRKLKWEYYTGKLDQATLKELGWSPFPHILKSDISTYMDADKDVLIMVKKIDMYEEIVSICESIMKELNSRTFQLRDIVQWERFISGVN